MRPQLTVMKCVFAVGAAGLLLAGLVYGQSRAAAERAEKADIVRHVRLVGAGTRILIDSPKFQVSSSLPGGVKVPQKWGKITVTYDTTAEWVDDLSFQFFVMSRKMEGNKATFSFYTLTVRYMDVRRGTGHECSVFLRPTALERYGEVIASAVEISTGGKVVAEESHAEGVGKLQDKWWRQPAVVESKDVVARDGYLLNRSQSPFALVNIDDQEAIRQ